MATEIPLLQLATPVAIDAAVVAAEAAAEGALVSQAAAAASAEAAQTSATNIDISVTAAIDAALLDLDMVGTMEPYATAAAASATLAGEHRAAIEGVVATNDSIMASVAADSGSAFTSALSGAFVPNWKPSTVYAAGAKAVSPSGVIVIATASFTSGATYNAANWNLPAELAAKAAAADVVTLRAAAKNPDLLVTGTLTGDPLTSAQVVWPDNSPGTLTITSRHATGAVNAYNITYGSPVTKTFTQPAITRTTSGAATNVPQIVVT